MAAKSVCACCVGLAFTVPIVSASAKVKQTNVQKIR
jgi:hypothetical protein